MNHILRHDDWRNGRQAESNFAVAHPMFVSFVLLRLFIIVTIAISNFSLPAAAQSVVSDDIKHDTPGKTIQQGQFVHIDVNLVLVNVTVTDPYDRVVTGLEPDNFRVFENNVEQEIKYFSSEDVPISIGVIFDLSGNMANKVGKAKEAALQFFKTSNPQDEFFLVSFNERAELISAFTDSTDDLQSPQLGAKNEVITVLQVLPLEAVRENLAERGDSNPR